MIVPSLKLSLHLLPHHNTSFAALSHFCFRYRFVLALFFFLLSIASQHFFYICHKQITVFYVTTIYQYFKYLLLGINSIVTLYDLGGAYF